MVSGTSIRTGQGTLATLRQLFYEIQSRLWQQNNGTKMPNERIKRLTDQKKCLLTCRSSVQVNPCS